MPKLEQDVALRIERARVHFRQAMDGEAPKGREPVKFSPTDRHMVRRFVEQMQTEFQVIEEWMPWT